MPGSLCVKVAACPSHVFLISTPGSRISLWKTVVFKDGHVVLCSSCSCGTLTFPIARLGVSRPLNVADVCDSLGSWSMVGVAQWFPRLVY